MVSAHTSTKGKVLNFIAVVAACALGVIIASFFLRIKDASGNESKFHLGGPHTTPKTN